MTDKEKLEKALVHLKKFIDGDCVCDSDILADFPELRESEDEKIIEEIRFAVMQMHSERQDTKDRCLAWLEKQKEQKHPDGCFTCDEYKKGYEAGRLNDFTVGYNKAMKEQKPVEKQDYSGLNDFERAIHRGFLCAGIENVPITIIKETAQDCLAHLPAEWSDGNKQWFDAIIKDYEDLLSDDEDHDPAIQIKINLLKSLRPQPKQEWSEEDENNLNKLLQWDGIPLGLRRWVSGLPEKVGTRPSWKPTEEQICCFERLIAFKNPEPEDIKGCESLLEQLKKL